MIRCPDCGYAPCEEARYSGGKSDMPETVEDELEFFEVAGCDEGCVMCPECAGEFAVDPVWFQVAENGAGT